MRPARLPAAILAATLLLAACGGGDEPEEEPSSAMPSEVASPTPEPVVLAPLTGVAYPEDTDLSGPVMAVKVENTRAARPQIGLDLADVVYEEVVEGGITRFLALFHSQIPDTVGPVRSARLIDVQLLVPYRPILVYSGARDDVTAALARTDRIGLLADSGRPVFGRDPERSRAHDLMAFGPLAYERGQTLDDVGAFQSPLTFDEQPPAGGAAATELTVKMSGSSITGWAWDAVAGVYRRSQDGEPHEVVDGEIGAANVVVILTTIGPGGCCDTNGSRFVETRMTGDGDAVVLRDGRRFDASWSKADASEHLQILGSDGEPFPLAPGPTWILLAPTTALDPA